VANLQVIIVEMEEYVSGVKEEGIRKENIELLTPLFKSMLRKLFYLLSSYEQQTGNSTVGGWRWSRLQQNSVGNDLKRLILASSTLGGKKS